MGKISGYLSQPRRLILSLSAHGFLPFLSDESYLKLKFKERMGYELDLKHPATLNEKLQWLKLYDRKPIYSVMVDKYAVKQYLAEQIGEEYVIPAIGVWNSFDEIDFDSLPDQFVLKCTHDSGGIIVCTDKKKLDRAASKKKLDHAMKMNFYLISREWPYKNVKPRIIAEPYLVDESGWELKDYKIFCFNGVPDYVEVDFNRFIEHKLNPYDFDWNPLNFCDKSRNDYSANIPKPKRLEDMRAIAAKLSKDMDFLRVDFYSIEDRIYVGELTLCPGSGYIAFDPRDRDEYYGRKLQLTCFDALETHHR